MVASAKTLRSLAPRPQDSSGLRAGAGDAVRFRAPASFAGSTALPQEVDSPAGWTFSLDLFTGTASSWLLSFFFSVQVRAPSNLIARALVGTSRRPATPIIYAVAEMAIAVLGSPPLCSCAAQSAAARVALEHTRPPGRCMGFGIFAAVAAAPPMQRAT